MLIVNIISIGNLFALQLLMDTFMHLYVGSFNLLNFYKDVVCPTVLFLAVLLFFLFPLPGPYRMFPAFDW